MRNPRYSNPNGGILIEKDSGVDLYIDSGELYQLVLAGEFGPVAAWEPPPRTLADAAAEKLSALAGLRYQKETAGVAVSGATVKTDRHSQSALTGAYTTLKNGLLPGIDWKAAGGVWVSLTLAQVEPMAQAVAAHVQACFSNEKAHAAAIAALAADPTTTPEAIDAYDISAGWPA